MTRWNERADVQRGSDYDQRWKRLEAAGESIHGEADLICTFSPRSVLDAGCGTGRVAIELAARGIDVVGVDFDATMLASAREKAPRLVWVEGDLCDVTFTDAGSTRRFDVVAMAGNVMIFVAPGSEPLVLANMAHHLDEGGRLVVGFELGPELLTLDRYDELATDVGLALESRWSTWDRREYTGGDYAVSVHRRLP